MNEKLIESIVKKIDALHLLKDDLGSQIFDKILEQYESKIREIKNGKQRVIQGSMDLKKQ